ncbi:MAG: hypothetical protein ACLFTK_14390 [Anaerolineales bacterium]
MIIFIAASLLAIMPPLSGAAIIIFWRSAPPRARSTLGLGVPVLLSAALLAMLGAGSALLDGRQPFIPYLVVTSIPAFAVWRAMQIELTYAFRSDNNPN